MGDNKDTIEIEPKKSVIPSILFIIYHLGLIGSIIGIIVNAVFVYESSGTSEVAHAGLVTAFVIGMHFFGNLLYKEYGHNSFFRRSLSKQLKPTLREKTDALHALKQTQVGKPQKDNPHDTPLFMVDDDGQHGPFSKQQLTDRLSKGEFSADALYSEKGTKDWYDLKSWNK